MSKDDMTTMGGVENGRNEDDINIWLCTSPFNLKTFTFLQTMHQVKYK